MSEPNDTRLKEDKGLEEYLRRESAVSQRYRELDADEVPPQLDAAVLARARAAIATPSKRKPNPMTRWVKWGAPLALAASAVMVVAIVLEVGVQDEVRMPVPQVEQPTSTTPAPEARGVRDITPEAPPELNASPQPEAPPEAPRERKAEVRRAPAPTSTERAAVESIVATGQPASTVPMDSARSVEVTGDALEEEVVTANSRLDMTARKEMTAPESDSDTPQLAASGSESQRTHGKVAEASAPAAAARSTAITPQTAAAVQYATPPPTAQVPRLEPDAWLERIRALRREGKALEADQQWREFREAYPQFAVSETDSARPQP